MVMLKELDTHHQLLNVQFNHSKWSTDLPAEILELIADRLLLLEFLAFRGVCREWRRATSAYYTTTAQTNDLTPWILFHRESDNPNSTSPWCCLYNKSSKRTYTVEIPELEGASCIASKEGWLLVHCHGHLFFLNPFSRAKVDLPEFPHAVLPNQVATFSSLPTDKDCAVFFVHRIDRETIEVSTCCRGDRKWSFHSWHLDTTKIETITYATFVECEDALYFADSSTGIGTFNVRCGSFKFYRLRPAGPGNDHNYLPFGMTRNGFKLEDSGPDLKSWLSKSSKKKQSIPYLFSWLFKFNKRKQPISFTTCGTTVRGRKYDEITPWEQKDYEVEADASTEKICVKAIWVMPWFAQLSPAESDYRWTA